MRETITRRRLLAGLGGGLMTAALSSTALAEAPVTSVVPKLRPADFIKRTVSGVDRLMAEAQLTGKVGFVVADARSGLVLEAQNAGLALPPASVTKAVTTAYGVSTLGGGHRYSTQLVAEGSIAGNTVKGDLILVGGGDPMLDTNALERMVKSLKEKGIIRITGQFKYYAEALPYVQAIDPEQPDHLGYNPAVSGLNLNYNRVHFEWKRAGQGYAVAMDARSDRVRPAVTSARMKVVNRDLPVYTYKAGSGGDHWTVARGALGKGGSRWLPVRKPGLYAAEVFQVLARSKGIKLPAPKQARSRPKGTVLVSQKSAELNAIARGMMKYSTNLTAEIVGLSASQARGGNPSSLAASARMMSKWAKQNLGAKSARFADHSGLSEDNRLTAQDMVRMLLTLGPEAPLHGLMKEIVPRGRDGKKIKNAPYSVRAKTGTLNFVSALSGYVTGADGTPLVFAIFTADMDRRKAIRRADRERPKGAKSWSQRSRRLQYQLVNRWAVLYGS